MLAGPSTDSVADDPEGARVYAAVGEAWQTLPAVVRSRVHLAALPMSDTEENAAIVNGLQRHADVVVQKSLAEGFGLTVAEAMWKQRPVVASRIERKSGPDRRWRVRNTDLEPKRPTRVRSCGRPVARGA